MRKNVGNSVIELIEGDLTLENSDAIVNAANSTLLGGGGVDGAIHRAGGPVILEECRVLGGCAPGEAKITTGGKLKARYVIHTVGPIYRGGSSGEEDVLKNAYRNSLIVASNNSIKSISFPSISTGAYSYPLDKAAKVALFTVIDYLMNDSSIETVRFVLFGHSNFHAYERALSDLFSDMK